MNTSSLQRRAIFGLGLTMLAMLMTPLESRAQSQGPALPPVSIAKALFFENNPGAWTQFLSQLPRVPPDSPLATAPRALPPFGGTWQAVTSAPAGVCNPLLLTDGTVIAHECNTPDWFKLTPDITGSYVNGTWSQIASLPDIGGTQYAPQYHASAVLPDGRVIIMGGEYNGSNTEVFTSLGAIYDPLANTWTAVAPPAGMARIGDAQSVVLANGTFLLGSCCDKPDVDALFNATTLGWTDTGAPSAGGLLQDEQNYNLLPNGNVLTIDIWTDFEKKIKANPKNAEQYTPSSGTWSTAGSTPVSLVDPYQCGNYEIGPDALRADGTLVAFGGNSGCVTPKADPTAIYDSTGGTWSAGPNVPAVCGPRGKASCTLADAPAALLPNGNILFAASAGYAMPLTHFFEFTSANAIDQVADTLFFASTSSSYYYNFLVLPTGQILSTDFSSTAEIYTPTGTANASWAPVIAAAPSTAVAGATYPISGTQFNGLSQGAYYGDDVQGATNFPIVQITNSASGHVFYARTSNHSTMSIEPGASGATNFTMPQKVETGASQLVVIANGISSEPVGVAVLGATTTALGASPNPSAFGQSVTFTATVSSSSGTPTGKVTFKNGSANLGTSALKGGVATLATTTLSVGTKSITAVYDGSAAFARSTSSVLSQVVQQATSTVTLTSSLNPSTSGQPVTFKATVAAEFSGTPAGNVMFRNGSATLGAVALAGGVASFTTSSLTLGTHTITARYVGSADFSGGSATLKQTVN